jgi:hypothetical protein
VTIAFPPGPLPAFAAAFFASAAALLALVEESAGGFPTEEEGLVGVEAGGLGVAGGLFAASCAPLNIASGIPGLLPVELANAPGSCAFTIEPPCPGSPLTLDPGTLVVFGSGISICPGDILGPSGDPAGNLLDAGVGVGSVPVNGILLGFLKF